MSIPTYTLEQYYALTSAYSQGITSIKYGDKELHYRSLAEMKQLLSEMEVSLGLKKRINRKYAQHTKGLQ